MENSSNTLKNTVSLLAQARIAAGLSLVELAEITRIPYDYIQALEAHDYVNFPSYLFFIGYLRNCADLLDVDMNTLLDDYDLNELNRGSLDRDLKGNDQFNQRYFWGLDKSQLQWLFCSFAATVTVTLLVFFVLAGQESQHSDGMVDHRDQFMVEPVLVEAHSLIKAAERSESELDLDLDLDLDQPIGQPKVIDQDYDLVTDALGSAPVLLTSALQASPQRVAPLVEAELDSIGDEVLSLLELEFEGASWVELTDAAGKRLYRDMAKKGSKLAFSAKLPMDLLLGDGRQVSVFLNRQPFAIQSYRDDNSVRLTIDTP